MKKIFILVAAVVLGLTATHANLSKQSSISKPSSSVSGNSSVTKPTSVSTQTQNNSKPNATKTADRSKSQAHSESSVISTSNQAAAEAYIAQHGLTLVQSTMIDENHSLLTVTENPSDPKVQGITTAVPNTKTSANYIYHAVFTPNDPFYSSQWALAKISAPAAWDISTGSSGTTIAIIDTGVLFSQTFGTPSATYNQVDFPTSRMWTNPGESGGGKETNGIDDDGNGKIDDWQGWDFMGGWAGGVNCPNGTSGNYLFEDNDPQPYSCDNPDNTSQLNKNHYNNSCDYGLAGSGGACYIGHGTMVASVAAASTNNGQLIAGLNHNTKLMNLRALDGYGVTDTALITAAVRYATSKGVDVINLSLAITNCSNSFSDPLLESALSDAKTAGITVVAAAGNEGASNPGSVCYPGSSSNVIGVGATDINDNLANFSNFGPQLDVTAPGVNVYVDNAPSSYLPSDSYATGNGTSFSTPYVAGLAALLKTKVPSASPDDIYHLITQQTDKVPGMQGADRTDHYGYGRINALHSLIAASSPANTTDVALTAGGALHKDDFMLSTNGRLVLTLQYDGNLVLYSDFKKVWETGALGTNADRVVMQSDGNFVVYDNNNRVLWNTATHGNANARLLIQNDGNLVMYSSINVVLWTSNTMLNSNSSDYVNTMMSPGANGIARLYPGQSLISADRRFRLALQPDGNLVLYSPTKALWSSGTNGQQTAFLALQSDGNLVLYNRSAQPLWNSHTDGFGSLHLIVQTDGNLVLYDNQNVPHWSSQTAGSF